jgi:hypothetical protein
MSEEHSRKKKKSSKRKSSRSSSVQEDSSRHSSNPEMPEDAEGGLYGNSSRVANDDAPAPNSNRNNTSASGDIFNHQF